VEYILAMFSLNINLGASTGDRMDIVCMMKRKNVWPLVFLKPCGKDKTYIDFYCMVEDNVIYLFIFS
jgi:hypothetical protein